MLKNNCIDYIVLYLKRVIETDGIPSNRILYKQMSAIIVDSILQAGLNYDTVIKPRIENLLRNYPDYKTTSEFIFLYKQISLSHLINWKNEIKLNRINNLSNYLFNFDIETPEQLLLWISKDENYIDIMKINGIGLKTADYLRMLVGYESIPIDRHLFRFFEKMGISTLGYRQVSEICNEVSLRLQIKPHILDAILWQHLKSIGNNYDISDEFKFFDEKDTFQLNLKSFY